MSCEVDAVHPEWMYLGDIRFDEPYARLVHSADRAAMLARLTDEEVVEALAAASRSGDPLLANVLATEATNRMRRLRNSLANLGEGVITTGADSTVVWANPAAAQLLGFTRDEMIGQRLPDLIMPPSANLFVSLLAQRDARGDADQLVRRDGTRLDVTYTVAPVVTPEGEESGFVITLADCSLRRQQERELRESEQRFRSLFEHFPDSILTLDIAGTILDANPASQRVTSLPVREVRGRPFADFLDEKDRPRAAELFQRVVEGGIATALVRAVRADGTRVLVEAWAIPIVVDGQVVGIHGLAREKAQIG